MSERPFKVLGIQQIAVGGLDLWVDEVGARSLLAYVPEQPELTPYATIEEVRRAAEPGDRHRPLLLPSQLPVADDLRAGVLRHRNDGSRSGPF